MLCLRCCAQSKKDKKKDKEPSAFDAVSALLAAEGGGEEFDPSAFKKSKKKDKKKDKEEPPAEGGEGEAFDPRWARSLRELPHPTFACKGQMRAWTDRVVCPALLQCLQEEEK